MTKAKEEIQHLFFVIYCSLAIIIMLNVKLYGEFLCLRIDSMQTYIGLEWNTEYKRNNHKQRLIFYQH